jgi:membrane protein
LSSLIISRYLHSAERTYGTFATVITMLWWFYLQSIIILLGAQLNAVLKERLHPRGLVESPATDADYRAYDAYAKERTYHHDEQVHTQFPPDDPDTKYHLPLQSRSGLVIIGRRVRSIFERVSTS